MRVNADPASPTEATPLIRSETSSGGPQSDGTAPSSEIYRDAEATDREALDEPNQKVGPGRALAIVLSVYVLIFLQGRSWWWDSRLSAVANLAMPYLKPAT